MSKLKIAIFEPNFLTPKPNAPTNLVLLQNQANAFSEMGHEVIIYAEGVAHQKTEDYTIMPLSGKLTYFKSHFSPSKKNIPILSGFFSPSTLIKTIDAINKESPDVIYTAGTGFSGVFSAILGRKTKVPNVHYITDSTLSWDWWRGDIDAFIDYKLPLKHNISRILKNAPRELVRRKFIAQWAISNISKLIVLSEYTKSDLMGLYKGVDEPSVIYPGVDLPTLPESPIETETSIITYMGHLWQGRGVLDLVKSFNLVRKSHPKTKLVIASSNVHKLTEHYFKKMTTEYNLGDGIIRKGIVKDPFTELLRPSTAVVFPYRDSPSIKLIEAMAAGIPVVTTLLGWSPELIVNNKNGFLVEVGDFKKIGDNLNFLIENPDARLDIGNNARKSIEKKCDINKNSRKILDVFKEAMKDDT